MYLYLQFVFIFYMGCTCGWIVELLFRRIVHGKWVNPGFLIGPYLPIYGFGLSILTVLYLVFKNMHINPILVILLMGFLMTLIELIGGLIGLKNKVKLWDYSDRWGNFKGIICPLFSAIWTIASGVYYYILAPHVMNALKWFDNNLIFCYILGLFTGLIVIDFIYSCKLYKKIKKFAKENDIVVKYEQLKSYIKDLKIKSKEKYSFLNPFEQSKQLVEYLTSFIDGINKNTNK